MLIRTVQLVFFSIALMGMFCAPKRNNPLDPVNPHYEPPEFVFETEVTKQQVFTDDSVLISWKGNNLYNEFNYRLIDSEWSGWSSDYTSFLAKLDDDDYTLVVQVRYPEGEDVYNDTVSFSVNALVSPAIYLYPLQQVISEDEAEVTLKAKCLPATSLIHITIVGATVTRIIPINSEKNKDVNILNDGNTVDLIILPGGTPIEGDCGIAKITVNNITGTDGYINLKECVARDSNDTEISVATHRGGYIKRQ